MRNNKEFKKALLAHVDYLNIVSIANDYNIDVGKRKKTPINNYNTAMATTARMFRHVALKYLEKNGILINANFRAGRRPRMILETGPGIEFNTLYEINYFNRVGGISLSNDDNEINNLMGELRGYIVRFTSWSIESGYEYHANQFIKDVNYSKTLERFIRIIELTNKITSLAKEIKKNGFVPIVKTEKVTLSADNSIIQSRKVSSQELFNRAFEKWRDVSEN